MFYFDDFRVQYNIKLFQNLDLPVLNNMLPLRYTCLVTFENATDNLFNFAVTLMYFTSNSISCGQRVNLVLVYAMADGE